MKYLLSFLLVAGAFLAVSGQNAAGAETAASIQGKVSHGVNADASVSGLEVTLVGLGPDGAPLESRKTTTGATGGFAFTDLAAGEGYIYQVGVRYAEVTYASAGLRLTADTPTTVEVKVFETTTSADAIVSRIDHLVLEVDTEANVLWVLEYLAIENTGNLTFVGSDHGEGAQGAPRPTLRFPLQDNVQEVSVVEGLDPNRLIPWEDGFADTTPVAPGMREVTISYSIPITGKSLSLSKGVAYPTDRVALLVPEGLKAKSALLTSSKTSTQEGQTFTSLSADAVKAGTTMDIQVEGLSAASSSGSGPDRTLLVGIGLLLVAAAAAAVLYVRRQRESVALEAVAVTLDSGDQRAALLAQLASLDQRFEEGQIGEEEYRREREDAKQRLRTVW